MKKVLLFLCAMISCTSMNADLTNPAETAKAIRENKEVDGFEILLGHLICLEHMQGDFDFLLHVLEYFGKESADRNVAYFAKTERDPERVAVFKKNMEEEHSKEIAAFIEACQSCQEYAPLFEAELKKRIDVENKKDTQSI